MAESLIAVVRDAEGRVHYGARSGAFITAGLADGSLIDVEAADGAADAEDGDDHDTGAGHDRSRNRKPKAGATDGADGEGVA